MAETKTKKPSTPPLIKDYGDKSSFKEEEDDQEFNGFLKSRKGTHNHNTATVGCMTFYSHRRHSHKGHLERKEQKNKEAILGKQLKEKWALQDLIDKQFKRCNQAMTPTKLEDVAQMLSPLWTAPLEMVAVGWLGDWRPSAILEYLKSLAHSSYFSADSAEIDRILSQLIHEIRIEEAIIDEEMAEIQATCILHLFKPANQPTTSFTGSMDSVQSQLKQIKQVITKAQQLRCKVLELIMKKVLNEGDVGMFLVAFSGTQDALHQFAAQQKSQKGPVCVSVKALAAV